MDNIKDFNNITYDEAVEYLLDIPRFMKKTDLKISDMDAIAVTYAPGLMGGLLVGIEFAKTLAYVYDKPLIKVNHIVGHIYANNL